MPNASVGSEWVSGALVFFDKATHTTIVTIDPVTLKLQANTGMAQAVESGTTSATLVNYGVSTITIGSTTGATKAYTLAAPATGVAKWVTCATASTGGTATVTLESGNYKNSTGTNTIATFSSQGDLSLMGISTSRYAVISASTTISFS